MNPMVAAVVGGALLLGAAVIHFLVTPRVPEEQRQWILVVVLSDGLLGLAFLIYGIHGLL